MVNTAKHITTREEAQVAEAVNAIGRRAEIGQQRRLALAGYIIGDVPELVPAVAEALETVLREVA